MDLLKQLENKLQALVQQRNQFRDEVAALKADHGSSEEEMNSLRRRLEDLQSEHAAMVRERETVKDQVEAILKRERPKFFYVTPNFANPSGVLVSQAKRRALYQLAQRYDLWIVEDDAYGELYFDEVSPSDVLPMKALDTDGRVLYMTTFSKTIAPGLRVAVIAAPPKVISLTRVK